MNNNVIVPDADEQERNPRSRSAKRSSRKEMINDKDINISEKPIAEEKAQASQEPPKQETPQQEPQQQEAPQASLKEVIAKQAIEEEASGSSSFTLRKILGGDILTAQIIRREIRLLSSSCFLSLSTYPTDTISRTISSSWTNCRKNWQDTKYKALSTSSQITEKSRESNVLDMPKNNKDSVLHIATQPPYIINVPEE